MPTPERPILAERTAYVPGYKSETFIVPLLAAAISQAISTHVTGGKCLDVGCGGQPYRLELKRLGCQYFSLDAKPTAGIEVDFVCPIDGPDLGHARESGPYDFILATEVLEHVADWSAAFQNLASLLAPGGRMVLTSPHFYILHEQPYDFFRPTTHAFDHFAARHGLTVLESRQLGDAWDILGTLLSSCRFKALGDSRLNRVTAWLLWKLRDWCFDRIKSGAIRRRVAFTGPIYLSNLIVVERPR